MSEITFDFTGYGFLDKTSEIWVISPDSTNSNRKCAVIPNYWINGKIITFPNANVQIFLRYEFRRNAKWRLQKEELITASQFVAIFAK